MQICHHWWLESTIYCFRGFPHVHLLGSVYNAMLHFLCREIATSYSFFTLVPLLWVTMFDDIRVLVARSYTSSPTVPCALKHASRIRTRLPHQNMPPASKHASRIKTRLPHQNMPPASKHGSYIKTRLMHRNTHPASKHASSIKTRLPRQNMAPASKHTYSIKTRL